MRLNYTGKLFNYTANKYQPTWTDNTTIKVEEKGETISSEYWGKIINSTHLPSYSQTIPYKEEQIKADLQFLNARLDYLRKTITYWDSYQIKDTIENLDEIHKIDILEQGKSLIINSKESFIWNNNECRRGGVFVNTFDQGIVYISPLSAGIYKPVITPIDGGIKIAYEFSDSIVDSEETHRIPFDEPEIYYAESKTIGINYVGDITPDFNLDSSNTIFNIECKSSILPVLAFYYNDEEINIDYKITKQGNNYQVECIIPETGVLSELIIVKVK